MKHSATALNPTLIHGYNTTITQRTQISYYADRSTFRRLDQQFHNPTHSQLAPAVCCTALPHLRQPIDLTNLKSARFSHTPARNMHAASIMPPGTLIEWGVANVSLTDSRTTRACDHEHSDVT
jgi:hypothetical protein